MLNIVISGGSDGLGKEIAKRLARENKVIILSHNLEKLKSVSQELGCDYVFADISDYDLVSKAIDTVLQKYNKIDVLINNAGIWTGGYLEDNEPDKIKEIISVNTLGTIFLSKAVIPSMKRVKSGRIINIISQDGLVSKKKRSVYSASKWAITGFTKCLQADLSEFNIGVTGIYPGLMKSSLFEKQGVKRDLKNSLELSDVSSLVEYVINLSLDTFLPEISIKNIKNKTTMDDSNSAVNDINLNPDMMTTQSSMPSLAPQQTSSTTGSATDPLKTSAPVSSGVIDITPGAPGDSHQSQVEDITPTGDTPSSADQVTPLATPPIVEPLSPTPMTTAPVLTPATETPAEPENITPLTSVTPVEAPKTETQAFIDTHDDEHSPSSSGGHLADLASATTTEAPQTPSSTEPVITTPSITTDATVPTPLETPTLENTSMTTTPVAPTQTSASSDPMVPTPQVQPVESTSSSQPIMGATPAVEVGLPPAAPPSAFAEDPDAVKVIK